MTNSVGKEIALGDGFGEVAVKVNGATIEVHADGSLDTYARGAVVVHLATLAEPKPGPKVGDAMPDGTIYAGPSPDSNKPMYATPADAPLTYTFNQAQKYAAMLDAYDHHDWRVPTKSELNVLYNNRAAIGGFNETGSEPGGWYWSSSHYSFNLARDQRFSDGSQGINTENFGSSLRCVR